MSLKYSKDLSVLIRTAAKEQSKVLFNKTRIMADRLFVYMLFLCSAYSSYRDGYDLLLREL